MFRSTRTLAVLPVLLLAFAGSAAALDPVSTCGQQLTHGGYLVNDLDCSAAAGHAVSLTKGRLELRGFSIKNATGYGVSCLRGCIILGPGTITNNAFEGVRAGSLKIKNVTVSDNNNSGLHVGVDDGKSGKATVDGCTITGNHAGIEAGKLARIKDSTITGNSGPGVIAGPVCGFGRVLVRNSTITGNATDPDCNTSFACGDIMACTPPKLKGTTTCGTSCDSSVTATCSTWGVCTLD